MYAWQHVFNYYTFWIGSKTVVIAGCYHFFDHFCCYIVLGLQTILDCIFFSYNSQPIRSTICNCYKFFTNIVLLLLSVKRLFSQNSVYWNTLEGRSKSWNPSFIILTLNETAISTNISYCNVLHYALNPNMLPPLTLICSLYKLISLYFHIKL